MLDLEKEIMLKVKELLETKESVKNIEIYLNLEGSIVLKYTYNEEQYIVSVDCLY